MDNVKIDELPEFTRITFFDGETLDLPYCLPGFKWVGDGKYAFFERYGNLVRWVIERNVCNKAYHNTHHLIGMGYIAYELARRVVLGWNDEAVDRIVAAALLHDFCHPGGSNDEENIQVTLTAIDNSGFWTEWDYDRPTVERLIRGTQWPMPADLELDKAIKVLRDADQLYATAFFTLTMSTRLFRELGPRFKVYNYATWLSRNVDYIYSLVDTFHYNETERAFNAALPQVVKMHVKELEHYCKELENAR
jgi:hypothetical protein